MSLYSFLFSNAESSASKGAPRLGIRLTTAYIFALSIVGSLSAGAHLVLDSVITEQANTARVINVAASERMLSQRIALASMEYMATSSKESHDRLVAAINAMRGGHHYLSTGGRDSTAPFNLTPKVQEIYFGATHDFNSRTLTYLAQAELVASSRDEKAYAYVKSESDVNMVRMADKVTQIFESEAGDRINHLRGTQQWVLVVLLLTLAGEAFFIFRPMVQRIIKVTKSLYDLAIKDPLTGLLTRRAFHDYAIKTLATCLRAKIPCALLAIDVDNFAEFNKQHGRAAGDRVLRRIGEILGGHLRTGDILARYNSNMFMVMLPATDLAGTTIVAERLREAMGMPSKTGESVTISAGISYARPMVDRRNADTLEAMITRAREAMDAAKQDGGNIVMVTPNHDPVPSAEKPQS